MQHSTMDHKIQALYQALQISVYPWERISETHIDPTGSQLSFLDLGLR